MKKPANWKELNRNQLTNRINNLNEWNTNKLSSLAAHNSHYLTEIEPLVKRRDELIKSLVNKAEYENFEDFIQAKKSTNIVSC
jgi:hypothetical protein